MEPLFAYGTLRDPAIQQKLLARTLAGQADTLDGFELFSVRLGRQTYPMIRPSSRANVSVAGTVFMIRPDELAILDDYETDAYLRVQITLRSGLVAWVYRQPS